MNKRLIIVSVIAALGGLLFGFAPSISIFILGRFIGGIAVGGASVVSPMYISEIAPAKYRGRLTVTFDGGSCSDFFYSFYFLLVEVRAGLCKNTDWMKL